MAIITLAEYKAYPYYNATTQTDPHITIFIQDVEEAYLHIRNIPFYTLECTTELDSADMTTSDDMDWVEKNMRVSGTGITEGTLVSDPDAENSTITLSAVATATNEDEELTFYPVGAKNVAAKMIKYLFDSVYKDDNLVSESIEKHSMTFSSGQDMIAGFPMAIVGRVKRYITTA